MVNILRVRAYFTDRRGVAAVEFALIAVPFLVLFFGIIELGFVFLNNNNLDVAVRHASRAILTGSLQAAGITSADGFRTTYICPSSGVNYLGSFIDCTKLIIDVRSPASFSAADMTGSFYKSATNQFCPGAPGAITVVRVAYPMPSYLPILEGTISTLIGVNFTGLVNDVPNNPGWKHLIVSAYAFATEPYNASSYVKPSGC